MTTPATDHTAEREVVRASDAPERATDPWFGKVRIFTQSVLPPSLAVYFAILTGRALIMDPKHDIDWSMVAMAAMCMAAAFGPTMFRDWMAHKETLAGKDG